MSPHEPKSGPPRLGLSLSQLVASALAAASAAFGASYLGVAGTIIGAAVASVIATVAGAMYTSSLQRTRHVVRSTVTQWSRTAAVAPVVDPNAPTPQVPHHQPDDTRELVIATEPPRAVRPLPWARLAVAAAAVLAVTLGALTGLEALLGKPISSAVGGSHATGTTLGSVGGSGGSHPGKKATTPSTPAPTAPSTPDGTPSGEPITTPTAEPTTEPSGSATAPPTSTPSTGPTTSPSAEATETPTAGG
jgi:hypothetical protein